MPPTQQQIEQNLTPDEADLLRRCADVIQAGGLGIQAQEATPEDNAEAAVALRQIAPDEIAAQGTVTACGLLVSGMVDKPSARTLSMVNPAGAQPDPLMPMTLPVPRGWIRAKQSPPGPVDIGSTTPCTAQAAIAASTALPPCLRISTAVIVASGCDVAAAPFIP